jgi:hypothetical protein
MAIVGAFVKFGVCKFNNWWVVEYTSSTGITRVWIHNVNRFLSFGVELFIVVVKVRPYKSSAVDPFPSLPSV